MSTGDQSKHSKLKMKLDKLKKKRKEQKMLDQQKQFDIPDQDIQAPLTARGGTRTDLSYGFSNDTNIQDQYRGTTVDYFNDSMALV